MESIGEMNKNYNTFLEINNKHLYIPLKNIYNTNDKNFLLYHCNYLITS